MEKTKRLLASYLPHLDLVLELADARAPRATRWPSLGAMLGPVPRMLLLNKADLADPAGTRRWLDHLVREAQGQVAMALSAGGPGARGGDAGRLRAAIRGVRAERVERAERAELPERAAPVRSALKVAVVGVPNVGKSALINLIAGKRRAPSGAKPGLTRGQQWVVVSPDLWILDLPGVLPPSPRNDRELAYLALTSTLPEGAYDEADVAVKLLQLLLAKVDPATLAAFLGLHPGGPLPPAADPPAWLTALAARRGLLGRHGEPQPAHAARILVTEFRRGRLGRFTLEEPDDDEQA